MEEVLRVYMLGRLGEGLHLLNLGEASSVLGVDLLVILP